MNRIFSVIAALALAAVAVGFAAGFDSMLFQMGVASAVATAAMVLLPKMHIGYRSAVGCDDIASQLAQLTTDLATNSRALTKQQDALVDAHKEVMSALEKSEKLAKEKQDNIDQAIAKANETASLVTELSQKMDDLKKSAESASQPALTVRGQIAKSLDGDLKDRYALLKSGEARNIRLTLKEISNADVSTGMKREAYIDSLVSKERQPLRIRDLLTIVPVQSDAVKYGKQVLRDNKARIVAEGTAKPYSDYKWEDATTTIETIAHLAKLTLQALADAPRLAAEVESEMRYGYSLIEEDEILNGDGTTGHLSGLIENSTTPSVTN